GRLVAPDEMTKWVQSMDQYRNGRGGDRPFYLAAWSGEPVTVDRAKFSREPIVVPHPFLTVVGGIVPDMLSALPEGRGRDDGFIARLLFAYPARVARRYSEAGIPDDVADNWERVVKSLWSRGMRELDGGPAPRVVTMTAEAAGERAEWCRARMARPVSLTRLEQSGFGLVSGLHQEVMGLGPTFDRPRLDSVRAMPHFVGADRPQYQTPQPPTPLRRRFSQSLRARPQGLHRPLEARPVRRPAVLPAPRRHHRPDHVVSQQPHPQLLAHHPRRLAPQHVQPEDHLDRPQIQLRLPPPTV